MAYFLPLSFVPSATEPIRVQVFLLEMELKSVMKLLEAITDPYRIPVVSYHLFSLYHQQDQLDSLQFCLIKLMIFPFLADVSLRVPLLLLLKFLS